MLLVIGCGGDDAAPGDATPDTPEQPVAIRVTRQSVPLEGLPVIFHHADGTLVDMLTTDADGRAEARTGPDGFVTAVTSFVAAEDVKTFAGVQPGDQLVIDGGPNAQTPMTTYTVRVSPVAGAVFYRVGVRCLVGTGEQAAPATNPVDLTVTTTCLAPTATLVVALDSLGFPIQSVLGTEATPTDGGTVDLVDAVPVTAETATLTLANAPQNTLLESARAIGAVQFLAATEPATTGAHPTVLPDVAGASQTVAVTGMRPVFAWGGASGAQTLDVAAAQVATIADAAIDRATGVVSWSGGADANFAFGQLFVQTDKTFVWSYAGPIASGATTLTLPVLADFPITQATRIDLELAVGRVDDLGARDELRRDGAWLDANNGIMGRQRSLFRSLNTSGTLGLSFTTNSVSF